MRTTTILAIITGVALALVAGGCADGLARGKAEREITKVLPEMLGPADSYTVKVDGKATEMMKGRVRGVRLSAINVQPVGLPRMARMEAIASNVVVDTKTHAILSSEETRWSGWLDNAELTRLMAGRVPLLHDLQITAHDGYVQATGKVTYLRVTASGSVRATPEIRNGSEIWMTPTRLDVFSLGAGVPAWAGQKAAEIVNPAYVIPRSVRGITLTGIAAEKDFLRLEGTMSLQDFVKARKND